jgi:small redox-active disulfide protein 2
MGLFDRKKEEKKCCCGEKAAPAAQTAGDSGAGIKVLGGGCAKCRELKANTAEALKQLGMEEEVGSVTDFAQIAAFGVMSTPALMVDGKVVSCGRVLKTDEVAAILKKVR